MRRETTNASFAVTRERNRARTRPKLKFILATFLIAVSYASHAAELLQKQLYEIEIHSIDAAKAINLLAEQTGAIVLFPYDLAEGRKANPVSGRYSLNDALDLLLKGTGLSGEISDNLSITLSIDEKGKPSEEGKPRGKENIPFTRKVSTFLTSLFKPATSTAQGQDNPSASGDADSKGVFLEEVVIIGLRKSLVRALDQKRMAERAEDIITAIDILDFPDQNVAEALQRLPGVQLQRENGEGRFVSIRGLGPEFNVVTMNGRLLASDSAGREFSFDTLPSELIQSASVIKSSSANMLEGSIGGTVDVRTARPFDLPGFFVTGSLAGSVETERGDWGPSASGLFSWTNDDDTLGVLLTGNYSERNFQLDRYDINGYFRASDQGYVDEGWPDVLGCASPGPCTGHSTLNDAWVPQAIDFFRINDTRTRETFTVTAQARPGDKLEVIFDALYSSYETTYDQYGFAIFARDFAINNAVVDDLGLNIDGNGDGDLSDPEDQVGARVISFTKVDGTSDIIRAAFPRDTETFHTGLNVVADLSDTLSGRFDISYSKASNDGVNRNFFYVTGAPLITWHNGYSLDVAYDLGTGPVPDISVAPEAMGPAYQRSHYIQRDGQDTEDVVLDLALDFDQQLEMGALASIEYGARYTTREKSVVGSFSADNYCYRVCGRDVLGIGFDYDENGVFVGTARDVLGTISGDFPRTIPIMDPAAYIRALDAVVPGLAAGLQAVTVEARSGVIDEEVTSLYAQINFDTDLGTVPVSGNFGLRYVSTDQTATGTGGNLVALRPSMTSQDTEFIFDNEGKASFVNDYDEVLPSLNIRMKLKDNLLLRFDASKVITRPTLSNLLSSITSLDQGYQRESISRGNPELSPFESTQFGASLEWYFDDTGAIFGSVFYKDMSNRVFNAQVQRTFPDENGTDPAVYASGGSAGQPIEVLVSQPQNTGDEKIKGLEIGIQKTFDNMPGFWSGFGIQANYTILDSKAFYDEALVRRVFGEDSDGAENFLRNPPTQGQGLSENSYNIVVFYEQDSFSARLAYNWRDEYLLSAITGPNGWALYEEERGQLDGNISFIPREGMVLFMDATNILQEEFSRFWDNGDTVAFDNFFESMNYYGRTVTIGLRLRY